MAHQMLVLRRIKCIGPFRSESFLKSFCVMYWIGGHKNWRINNRLHDDCIKRLYDSSTAKPESIYRDQRKRKWIDGKWYKKYWLFIPEILLWRNSRVIRNLLKRCRRRFFLKYIKSGDSQLKFWVCKSGIIISDSNPPFSTIFHPLVVKFSCNQWFRADPKGFRTPSQVL